MDLADWEWTCACCGRPKRGVPDLACDAPIHHLWAERGDPGFVTRFMDSDACRMEIAGAPAFFIRCLLVIPVAGLEGGFGLGVWSSLSEASFRRYAETYDDPQQSRIGPMFGYLANRLPGYPDMLGMKADVLPQDDNQRPLLRLWPEAEGHPLCEDQVQGMTPNRLAALLSEVMPCEGNG